MLQRFSAFVAAVGLCAVTAACSTSDSAITTNVKTKLAADETVRAAQVDVTTRNRVVTLSGAVESEMAKEQALRIARETDGVRDVIDQLRVGEAEATTGTAPDEDRDSNRGMVLSDAAITSSVKTKLLADATVRAVTIDVDTNEGVVTLSGQVGSRAEADQAVLLTRNTAGVKDVVDQLEIGRRPRE